MIASLIVRAVCLCATIVQLPFYWELRAEALRFMVEQVKGRHG